MNKWIVAAMLGLMACNAMAERTIRWVDENGIEEFKVIREPEDDAPVNYKAVVKPGENDPPPNHEIRVTREPGSTTIYDWNTGKYTICREGPDKRSWDCK